MVSERARITGAARQAKVRELVKAGYTFREIATALGYGGPAGAHYAFKAALKTMVRPAAEEARAVELARLDAMLKPLWPSAQRGNLKAIAAVLRLMERRAAYLGLDAPTRTEHTGADGGPIQVEATDARERLRARITELRDRRLPAPAAEQEEQSA